MSRLFTKPAASGLYHHSYDPVTVASMDFSRQVVSRIIECDPKDHFNKIACSADLLIAPQVFPPYGRCYLKTAAFFVPEHQLFDMSEAFHMNQDSYKGKVMKFPRISLFGLMNRVLASTFDSTLIKTLSSSTTGLSPDVDYPASDAYDFIYVHSGAGGIAVYEFYQLGVEGRRYYKLMKSLGYDFISPTFMFYATPPSGISLANYIVGENDIYVSAMPLLAYFKTFFDMFYPGTMYNTNISVSQLEQIRHNETVTVGGNTRYDSLTGVLEPDAVYWWYYDANVPVHQDMYTESWNNPNSPTSFVNINQANSSGIIGPYLPKSSYFTDDLGTNVNDNFIHNASGNAIYDITQRGLTLLKAFDKFVNRWNLAGTRAAQRVYAMFGIEPDAMKSNYVHKLYEGSELLRFHPVVSNADTSNSGGLGLGDFAGFGAGSLNFEFSYNCSDYGYIIVLHWLQLKPIMLHGVDPMVLRKDPFDWFTAQYDGQAMRAIPNIEISTLKDRRTDSSATSDPRGDKDIFGFTNIYDEYREMKDTVIGDFVCGQSKNFLFARDYTSLRSNSGTFKPQSDNVQFMTKGYTQPFQMSHSVGDRFWCQFSFDIEAERAMLPKSDALDLGSGDTEFNKNGQIMN